MTALLGLLTVAENDPFEGPSDEDEQDFWNGRGEIKFFVIQNTDDVFEIEYVDYTGCAGGMHDTLGIEYYIEHVWCLHKEVPLKEGVTYTLKGVTVLWTRGEWGFTDDDVEYDYEEIVAEWKFWTRTKNILHNLWWQNIGYKIRQWRMKK